MPRPKLFGAISRKKLRANRFASQKSQIQSNTIKERLEGYDDQPGCSTSSYDNNFETSNDTNNEEIKPFQVSGRRVIEIHSASQKSHKIASYAKAAQVRRTEESAPENKQRRSRNRKHNSQARARETSSERSQRLARQNVMRASRARAREISAERAQRLADLKRQHDSETRFRETSAQRSQRLATERQRATVTECYLMLKEVFRRRSRKPKLWTRAAAARRKNGKVVCPECNTDVDVEGRQGDKATAMLVNVYQYFATEGTKLSPSQLRERTALCTGASEEDVEHALGLYWSQTGDSDSQEAPSRKRRRVEEQPGDESHPLYVEVEVEAAEDEENGEEDPLTSEEEDIKPDITETCIQPVSQSSYIPVEDIKKETTEFEDGVS
ncbi:uncharacterized protein LOC118278959 isoform X2 [Spodoptera frugiperda]|uniref:Uncharacterized protein LOC118278959 isoform X2 n=1 Tax=Spodoptera frugiperda TaxID=7108 RepID=A0A9R0F5B9_SPOFR|nr:uncharacterized protein LOC118278959 isoform X2 [Spodoptera frugiperda]